MIGSNDTIGVHAEALEKHFTVGSYTSFNGTPEELIEIVLENVELASYSETDAGNCIAIVPVDVLNLTRFLCPVIHTAEAKEYVTNYVTRSKGEEPVLDTTGKGGFRLEATHCKVILYGRKALDENGERTTDCAWEIVSVNASPFETEPMSPTTMARNALGLKGGTKMTYTNEEWANAIMHSQRYIRVHA